MEVVLDFDISVQSQGSLELHRGTIFFVHCYGDSLINLYIFITINTLRSSYFNSTVNFSNPVRPNVLADSFCLNSRGRIPIPAKLLLWMRSNDTTMTALTP